jgi:hypothetical protein
MNKVNETRLFMYESVIAYCNNNAATTALVPAFQTALTAFQTVVGQINDTAQMEANVITGITSAKIKSKATLCDQAANLSAAVFAFASTTNNDQLKEEVGFSITDIKRLSDEMLVPTCANIRDAANANITALATYGITDAIVTDFQTAITDYKAKVVSPRNAVSQRSAYSTALSKFFEQANGILKDQLDKMALQFKTTAVGFYVVYRNNRTLIGPGTSATQITGTVTNSVTHLPLPGATVEVVGQPLKTTTNMQGFFILKTVSPGSRSIKVNIAGYGEKQEDDLLVKLGKTVTANIAVAPSAQA